MTSSIEVSNATVIDGVSEKPIQGQSIWIEGGRIKAIGRPAEFGRLSASRVIDATGKYVIPGLMNANVHLLIDLRLENLLRYMGRYTELVAEAAQVALKNGVTTVFDTNGPRQALMETRDRIERGELPGSRIFCAGWIVGFDGPFSQDFNPRVADVASASLVRQINSTFVGNVGRHLMWLSPDQVADEVRKYVCTGVDFIKFASNDHFPGSFLTFSPDVQGAIVEEAHSAGLTAQAHCMSVEGLRVAIEAGCDLITHCNITGPVPIPEKTLDLFVRRRTGAVIFPWTRTGLDWIKANVSDLEWTMWQASDINARNLIRVGAPLMLATDGGIFGPEVLSDPAFNKSWAGAPEEDSLFPLATGHFFWLKAMEEKGCAPMEMLKAATRNVAVAYGKQKDLGTLEPGKIADLLVLEKNPLAGAENYRSVEIVVKDGAVVDRSALPLNPVLTKAVDPSSLEDPSYVPFLSSSRLPVCAMCMCR